MEAIENLRKLRSLDKFSKSEWEKRNVNPSSIEVNIKMDKLFNECLDDLIKSISEGNDGKTSKKILQKGLKRFNKSEFDTEEKEFICDRFFEVSKIVGVDFKDELNKWLYDSFMVFIMKAVRFFKGSDKVTDVVNNSCERCSTELSINIYGKLEEAIIEQFWIIRCESCGHYNLIDSPEKAKRIEFVNFTITESLDKKEFTLEKAKIRLEQIRHFRE